MSAKKRRLMAEWLIIYAENKAETLRTYNDTVRHGNTETYSEFVEEIRKGWMEEMMNK